jgi:Ni,Fe-hydrogenase III small subunit/ferredoxin-like protein FixX
MANWVYSGLRMGVKTTRYPRKADETPGVTPGLPAERSLDDGELGEVVERCPTGALIREPQRIRVDYRRCVHCFQCVRGTSDPLPWQGGYEWARAVQPENRRDPSAMGNESSSTWQPLSAAFARSIHVRVVDAGDCGACLREVKQLDNPYYNLHRLGFFITPTPRQADVLLVVGPGTDQMRSALRKAYSAMPTPRRVVAVGACALSGGVFGPSYMCSGGVGSIIPVDLEVPGNPPPPLAILHGLLVVTGRAREGSR